MENSFDKIKAQIGILKNDAFHANKILNAELSKVDTEINEIMHFIEFSYKLNACQGYKLFKMLQERRKIRRTIKQQQYVLQAFITVPTKSKTEPYQPKLFDFKTLLKLKNDN